jgi:DNA polymerase III subunit epsilon
VRFSVLDLETTGIYPGGHDRVLEIGIVSLDSDLAIEREYATLVNPNRDVGPTWLHGITAGEVLEAPAFEDIAGSVVDLLSDSVIVGHNVLFDLRFLEAEFARARSPIGRPPHFDTMSVSVRVGAGSRRLEEACELFGVPYAGGHTALGDARNTAALFARLVEHLGEPRVREVIVRSEPHTVWPEMRARRGPCTREDVAREASDPGTYLASLAQRLSVSGTGSDDWQAYFSVLDRALEDRRITKDEVAALHQAAEDAGMTRADVEEANLQYLESLVSVAMRDGIISTSERRDIDEVAALLSLQSKVSALLEGPSAQSQQLVGCAIELHGRTVCFTGAMNASIDGERATRERAIQAALEHGMIVVKSVTKKLDYLVVADPDSLSGKAKKARTYGTRILAEPVFWHLVGVDTDD